MNYEGKSVFQLVEQKEDPQVAVNTAAIAVNTAAIAANTADIDVNQALIAANALNIAANTNSVRILKHNQRAVLSSYVASSSELNRIQYSNYTPGVFYTSLFPQGVGVINGTTLVVCNYQSSDELYPYADTVSLQNDSIRHEPSDQTKVYRMFIDLKTYFRVTRSISDIFPLQLEFRLVIKRYNANDQLQGGGSISTTEYALEPPVAGINNYPINLRSSFDINYNTTGPGGLTKYSIITPEIRFTGSSVLPLQIDTIHSASDSSKQTDFRVEVSQL
jgi:hypothetical protein